MKTVLKELVRKSIHLCAGLVPFFLAWNKEYTIFFLSLVLLFYFVAEGLRQRGIRLPVISGLIELAARERDEGSFVMGPVTMALGVIITSLAFPYRSASLGIYALAFGDGLASLVGKCIGRCPIPFTHGKTAAGSLACFGAVYTVTLLITGDVTCALILAAVCTGIELLPLQDFDNLYIPIVIAGIAEFYFHR
ncbi:MAG: phosphatidate cytidylyltransferase [Treponema sp.]|nr:phosphatidate cytidylyltransferase [Candidatus Treponema caballi]